MFGLVIIFVLIGIFAMPEIILMPIVICLLLVSEKNNQREVKKNSENKSLRGMESYHHCSYAGENENACDYDEVGPCGFFSSSYDDDSWESNSFSQCYEDDERDDLDSLFSESNQSDDFSIYVNDSGLPTYWNDDGDLWGAPFGGI